MMDYRENAGSVSYTHLDVYKRQEGYSATKTTNEAGEIDISDLNPGVYTVTEQSIADNMHVEQQGTA